MKNRILEIFKDLMAMKSRTYSEEENLPAEYFGQFFRRLPYFKIKPHYTRVYEIPGDPFGRKIPYGFLEGKSKETVVLSGHFDVVSAEEYGLAEPFAYDPFGVLTEKLSNMELDERARADLDSGEWLWGRGSCDMKGGLAIHAALFEEYAKKAYEGRLEGSIIFMPVPDEESYSAGMRHGSHILSELKRKYGLNYKLFIDPEPTALEGESQVLSIGSVGKCMPTILVQGKKGHAGHFFDGLSALSIISRILNSINGSAEFCDTEGTESTVPPTWFKLRDMKEVYDVSIPHRACGYFTVFSFYTTPSEIMEKVKAICSRAVDKELEDMNKAYGKFNSVCGRENRHIFYKYKVLDFAELAEKLRQERGETFDSFYNELKRKVSEQVKTGELSYPDATLAVMEKLLDLSGLQEPVVLIGFAPPYYAPVHSDKVRGKEGYGTKAFEFVKQQSEKKFGRKVLKENYFMGISDLSYSAVTAPFDYRSYSDNTPMWGEEYSIDFTCIGELEMPSIIYGPAGLEYHQYTERVNKKSMLEEVPEITQKLIEYMWSI